jgi:hypothetical protein
MKQTCNDEYWEYMKYAMPDEAPCGQEFDDLDHSTLCPHPPLPPRLTEEEKTELFKGIQMNRMSRSRQLGRGGAFQ